MYLRYFVIFFLFCLLRGLVRKFGFVEMYLLDIGLVFMNLDL